MVTQAEHSDIRLRNNFSASQYSLFQLIRQIKAEYPTSQIQLRPALHRSILQGEVFQATQVGDDWCIDVNLPGLYGSSSPLPSYFTELLLEQAQQENTLPRQLLDLLNQRLYELKIEIEGKSHPAIQQLEEKNNQWLELATRLLGLPSERLAILPRKAWLFRHYHLLTHPYPTAQGLTQLVSSWLENFPVAVEECVIRQVQVGRDSLTSLGKANNSLGKSSLLGNQIIDRNSKLRIKIGPLSHESFSELIRNRKTWRTLRTLISVYLRSPYECELEFSLDAPKQLDAVNLGGLQWGHLGRNAWLLNKQTTDTPASLQALMPLI